MSNDDIARLALALLLLVAAANLLGQLFVRIHQPRVVGEILAGVLLGPSLLGRVAPGLAPEIFRAGSNDPASASLEFIYHLGLLLLMFVSGSSVRHVLGKENRRPTAWILGVGVPLPFLLALLLAPVLPLEEFMGAAHSETAVALIIAIATAVTSIPVISKIFSDLGILHTRFAGLMLGAAVLEDIALWGVLAIATAVAAATAGPGLAEAVTVHVLVNTAYVVAAMTAAPIALRRLSRSRWNLLAAEAPTAWIVAVLLAYVAAAAALEVTLVFAAFLAGFGIAGGVRATERQRFRPSLESLGSVAGSVFVPAYFAIVGYRLDFTRGFSPAMLAAFLLCSSLVATGSKGLGARLAGLRGRDVINVALTGNARGGPGIVLASVALDAGIINARFFSTLVVTAVLTSQACGFWLGHVLRRGWPLLTAEGQVENGLTPRSVEATMNADDRSTAS